MPEILIGLIIGIIFGGIVVGAMFYQRRRYWLNKRENRRPSRKSVSENLFPIRVGDFRAIVTRLKQTRAAELERELGHPIQFTAQDGEDVLLGEFFEYKRDGFFVEIGAYDGVHLSNSYFFEQMGWSGVLVEPLPSRVKACQVNRPNSTIIHAALGKDASGTITMTEVVGDNHEGTLSYVKEPPGLSRREVEEQNTVKHDVPFRTFEAAMGEHQITPDQAIDFISIDCEGMDFEVLQSIDLSRWQPRFVIIESYSESMAAHMGQFGYKPMLSIRANTIFGRQPADQAKLTRRTYWQSLGVGNEQQTQLIS